MSARAAVDLCSEIERSPSAYPQTMTIALDNLPCHSQMEGMHTSGHGELQLPDPRLRCEGEHPSSWRVAGRHVAAAVACQCHHLCQSHRCMCQGRRSGESWEVDAGPLGFVHVVHSPAGGGLTVSQRRVHDLWEFGRCLVFSTCLPVQSPNVPL